MCYHLGIAFELGPPLTLFLERRSRIERLVTFGVSWSHSVTKSGRSSYGSLGAGMHADTIKLLLLLPQSRRGVNRCACCCLSFAGHGCQKARGSGPSSSLVNLGATTSCPLPTHASFRYFCAIIATEFLVLEILVSIDVLKSVSYFFVTAIPLSD
jgi:hypothetical protein